MAACIRILVHVGQEAGRISEDSENTSSAVNSRSGVPAARLPAHVDVDRHLQPEICRPSMSLAWGCCGTYGGVGRTTRPAGSETCKGFGRILFQRSRASRRRRLPALFTPPPGPLYAGLATPDDPRAGHAQASALRALCMTLWKKCARFRVADSARRCTRVFEASGAGSRGPTQHPCLQLSAA
jgi:hypothetical protein